MKWIMTIGALLLTPALALGAASFSLSISPTTVPVGGTITVNVHVDTGGALSKGFSTAIKVNGEDVLLATDHDWHANNYVAMYGLYPYALHQPLGTPAAPLRRVRLARSPASVAEVVR